MKKNMSKIITVLILINSHSLWAELEKAVFAGGCFWCLEAPFEKVEGVDSVMAGYTGGSKKNPTYQEVSSGKSGHIESIQIIFDNKKISYGELLNIFWKNIDPFDGSGQFCDKGEQYQSGLFYLNDQQKKSAEDSLAKLQKEKNFLGKQIATFIRPGLDFYPAEEYHQDYYKKNPIRYKFYRFNCGRDKRLNEIWN
jgi:methionine-S-sulfoxide reductase